MHDNPQAGSGTVFALPDHRLVELRGPDATRFAQAQFMSDVAALAVGHWHWSGWLTPKGRVIALFAVIKLGDDRLWLLLPDAAPDIFAGALRRYVFRSKLEIAVRDDLCVSGAFAAPSAAAGNRVAGDATSGIELDLGADDGARSLLIGRDAAASNQSSLAQWATCDIAHGLPRLPASQVEQWTPQQLSLERLQAFSIRKGCYPGQEIVARTHFLGKAKRGLALIEGDRPLAVGAQLSGAAGGGASGSIVASASAAGRHLALAVMPLERDSGEFRLDSISVRETALQDGLAR